MSKPKVTVKDFGHDKSNIKDGTDEDVIDKEINKHLNKGMQKPFDNLDGDWLQTEPAYGKEAQPEFYQRLQALKGVAQPLYNADGTPQLDEYGRQKFAVDVVHLWDELAYFTRDIRLGNLRKNGSDVEVCEHYLNLAGDCLSLGCVNSFTSAYRRVAAKLEISQSRDGFFRKNRNTARLVRSNTENDPAKKKFFGGSKESE